ncbi:MAG: NAD-dependent epimerase/dehydratase family protein [Dehalococcoidia bacterium]
MIPRAVILGGTGVLGRATVRRLLAANWTIDLTGRDPSRMPAALTAAGARFHAADRHDSAALARILGDGADLLVDALCFTAADARQLTPLLQDVTSTVMLSSKAVYVDQEGRHSNSERSPHFAVPIREDHPTMSPSDADYNSREGYGANKVAAEQVLLDSGLPVTVIRPSKVHGEGAARPREWMFVKRVLDRRPAVFLAHRGEGTDHTTAAVNTAALIERIAAVPGRRVLNSADPDAPSGLEIARTIAGYLGHEWDEILLNDDAEPDLGRHPWDARPPIILDTTASLDLGYVPVGSYAQAVPAALDWLVEAARAGVVPGTEDPFFAPLLDYAAEDRYLLRSAMGTYS